MSTAGEHMNMNLKRCFFENDQQPMKDASRGFLSLSGQVVSALFFAFLGGKQPGSAGHSFGEFVLVPIRSSRIGSGMLVSSGC